MRTSEIGYEVLIGSLIKLLHAGRDTNDAHGFFTRWLLSGAWQNEV
jgi:hypothetical protein